MKNFGRHAPCTDKNCSICCNPVKMNQRAIINGLELPKDKEGNDLWKSRGEIIAPEDRVEKVRIATFDCVNYDKDTGKCLDYENRPDICKDTTCVHDENGDVDEQHKKATKIKFVKLK